MSNEHENLEAEGRKNEKEFTIYVNTRQKVVYERELTFNQVVNLAYNNSLPTGENIVFTITYRRGHGNKSEGYLYEGQSVPVKEGMIFDVAHTTKS